MTDLIRFSASILFLSQLVIARAIPDDLQPWLRSRSPSSLSKRATNNTNKPRRGVSILAIVVIVIFALAAIIGLVLLFYLCNRQRQNKKQEKLGHNMNYMATPVAPGANREGDWWQPPESTNNTLTSRPDNRQSAYGAGGQGYTYGQTVDHRASRLSPIPSHSPLPSQLDHSTTVIGDHRTSVIGDHRTTVMGDHRSSVLADPRTSVPAGGIGPQGSPFQIPVADYYRPRPPPSISPSYHTTAVGGEMSVEAGEPPHPAGQQQQSPPGFPRRQQTMEPLQPQQTGTSIYSSPYEVTAMTRSTAGHTGGH